MPGRLAGYGGLIFDLDGTLVDSMHLHLAAWRHAALRHGFAFDYDVYYDWGGMPSRKIARLINERHKPHPDTFLLAAERLSVPAGRCLVFEDSQTGFEAAAAAGMDHVPVEACEIRWNRLRCGRAAGRT